ncbi:MAG: hypothetical protein K9J12_00310 [Melioribacteraceae bacterium]|nr:hypothetical protein [Melioribacteraceae bacterium]MCF8264343.1 hypothetical protein [Melioribacteraceae bacterium]MCF8414296.1 hypothetical protein [Melioribacteraceae bacterium]MCF8431581.1 hypothetical protein [Melioribacteraceae bacterium]
MVIAFIWVLHIIFVLYVFYKKWKTENIASAFQNLFLIILLFAVGWSILELIVKLFMENEGFGNGFDRNTFVLSLLTICEFFFYKKYYAGITATGKGK